LQGPVRFYDNERKAYILLKQFLGKFLLDTGPVRGEERERENFAFRIKQIKYLFRNKFQRTGCNSAINEGIQMKNVSYRKRGCNFDSTKEFFYIALWI